MISGIGIDIIELDRMEKMIQRQPKLVQRILTESEQITYGNLTGKRKVEFLAGRFAAKEAFSKAVGTGIGKGLSFLDIEIKSNSEGKPEIILPYYEHIHLSISHGRDYAVAQVVIEK